MQTPHPSTAPELTKRHGNMLRLTPTGAALVDQRIVELCEKQTPGLDIAAIINKEMGLSYASRTYWRWVRQRGLVWTPGGRRRRLTAALVVRVDKRIAELCGQRTPAPDIAAIINREFGLNWSLNTYWKHLRDHGYVWTPGKRRTLGARTCQFQGKGCRGTFEANTAWQKYCDVCRKPAGAAVTKTYRKNHLEHFRERHKRYLPSFYRDSDPAKYRKMMDAINAQGRQWRKRNPEKAAAIYQRFKEKHPERLKESQKKGYERVRKLIALASKFPPDWWEKPIDWRIIGTELLSRDGYMSNRELANRLDRSRSLKCPYGPTWGSSRNSRGFLLRVNDVRNWVKRPGGTQKTA